MGQICPMISHLGEVLPWWLLSVHTCTSRLNGVHTHETHNYCTSSQTTPPASPCSLFPTPCPSSRSVGLFSWANAIHIQLLPSDGSSRSQLRSSGSLWNSSKSHCNCPRCAQLTVRPTPALVKLLNASLSICLSISTPVCSVAEQR